MEAKTKWIIGIGIGVVAVGITAYFTKSYWMPVKKTYKSSDLTETPPVPFKETAVKVNTGIVAKPIGASQTQRKK